MANETAGKKGVKLARFDLIPPYPLWQLAEVYGRGAEKYADRNWERGVGYMKLFGAMQRHANQFLAGEDIDPLDKQHHLASVAWMAFALLEMQRTHPELDDRPHVVLNQKPQSLSSDVTNQEEIDAAKTEAMLREAEDIRGWTEPGMKKIVDDFRPELKTVGVK